MCLFISRLLRCRGMISFAQDFPFTRFARIRFVWLGWSAEGTGRRHARVVGACFTYLRRSLFTTLGRSAAAHPDLSCFTRLTNLKHARWPPSPSPPNASNSIRLSRTQAECILAYVQVRQGRAQECGTVWPPSVGTGTGNAKYCLPIRTPPNLFLYTKPFVSNVADMKSTVVSLPLPLGTGLLFQTRHNRK